MSYLLDTCIVSKLRRLKKEPHQSLELWALSHSETSWHLSVLTIGEIQFGISRLKSSEGSHKRILEEWLLADLIPRFKGRIFPVDEHTTTIWGSLKGEQQQKGNVLPVIDSLIAATAIQHNLILVTENIKDFQHTGVRLLNPCL